jgi:hypothetical protein
VQNGFTRSSAKSTDICLTSAPEVTQGVDPLCPSGLTSDLHANIEDAYPNESWNELFRSEGKSTFKRSRLALLSEKQ